MKRNPLKLISCTILTGALMLSAGVVNAWAANSSVTLDGTGKKIVLYPQGEEGKSPDLFQEATKNMMPGDERSLVIGLSNTFTQNMTLFIRAEDTLADEFSSEEEKALSDELLARMELTVTNYDGKLLYQGTADGKTAKDPEGKVLNRTDNGYITIGTLGAGASGQLTVTVKVPTDLENRFQYSLAKVDWIFYAQVTEPQGEDGDDDDEHEYPVDPVDPVNPVNPEENPTEPTVEISEPDVPLSNLPPDLEIIEEPEVPLAQPEEVILVTPEGNLPQTGAVVNQEDANMEAMGGLVLLLLGACIVLAVIYKKSESDH